MQRNGLSAHLTQEKPLQTEQEGWPHSSGLKARRKAGTAHTETVSFRNESSASVFALCGGPSVPEARSEGWNLSRASQFLRTNLSPALLFPTRPRCQRLLKNVLRHTG